VLKETAHHWSSAWNEQLHKPQVFAVRGRQEKEIGFLWFDQSIEAYTAVWLGLATYTPSGEYQYAFDGENLVPIRKTVSKTIYKAKDRVNHHANGYLMVWKELHLVQCKNLRLYICDAPKNLCEVVLVDGVPGCGKTYKLIRSA
jgi:hypothetical protein